ncbi:hypothetical protein KHA96_11835 [Bacillus sp. FJAT-49711]|uniref:DUF7713 domain-containing protein n=1 Tax=Bacillus sp. FJAT-49711 TaxID=2833585 RepID=UPI001BC981CA|nr:hypothetical protein [Bacillus sp. FJAT-49711]MBS4219006.1 hypothetical protein [Bacillus sp. FJAT-49711]
MNKCEQCGSDDVRISITAGESMSVLCLNCYNEQMAKELEVEMEPLTETFTLNDFQGVSRTFIVERRIDPIGIFMEAKERGMFGYKFAVHGELYCNQDELLNTLIEKTSKGIEEQQVETKFFPNGQAYNLIKNDYFTGLIEYDENSENTPLVIIDGRPFTWEEVGKMLKAYEGFQIKIKCYDFTD